MASSASSRVMMIAPADEAGDLKNPLSEVFKLRTSQIPTPVHPLVFVHDVQFRGGLFYRYLLGYRNMPDKAVDNRLTAHLDKVLHEEFEVGDYDLAAYYLSKSKFVNTDPWLVGHRWNDSENPPTKHHKVGKTRFKAGTVIYVRSNLRSKKSRKYNKLPSQYYDVEGIDHRGKRVIVRAQELDFLKFFRSTRLTRLKETRLYEFERS